MSVVLNKVNILYLHVICDMFHILKRFTALIFEMYNIYSITSMFSVEVEITLLASACVFNILADLMFLSKESYLSFKVSFNLLEKKRMKI